MKTDGPGVRFDEQHDSNGLEAGGNPYASPLTDAIVDSSLSFEMIVDEPMIHSAAANNAQPRWREHLFWAIALIGIALGLFAWMVVEQSHTAATRGAGGLLATALLAYCLGIFFARQEVPRRTRELEEMGVVAGRSFTVTITADVMKIENVEQAVCHEFPLVRLQVVPVWRRGWFLVRHGKLDFPLPSMIGEHDGKSASQLLAHRIGAAQRRQVIRQLVSPFLWVTRWFGRREKDASDRIE